MWTYATFFGILLPTSFAVIQRRRTTGIRDIAIWGGLAGYTATVVNSTMWRTHEARMIESSPVIEKLVCVVRYRQINTTLEFMISLSPERNAMFPNF